MTDKPPSRDARAAIGGVLGWGLMLLPGRIRGRAAAILADKVYSGSLKYLAGALYNKGLNILLLPVWTYFLTPAQFGVVGVVLAYASLLTPLICLGLPSAVVRAFFDGPAEQGGKWRQYFSANATFVVVLAFTSVVLLALFGEGIWNAVTNATIPFHPFTLVLLGIVFIGCLNSISVSCFKAHQEHGFLTMTGVVGVTAAATVSLVLVVGFAQGPLGLLMGQVIGTGLVTLSLAVVAGKRWFVLPFSGKAIVAGLRFGLPLVPHTLALVILHVTDRIMLEKMGGLDQVGFYSVAIKLVTAVNVLIHSMGSAWTPRFYEIMQGGGASSAIRTYFRRWQWLVGGTVVGIILLGAEVYALILPASYDPSIILIGPLVCGAYFFGLYQFASGYLFFRKRTRTVALLSTSVTVLNIGLNLLLIPRFGALGASFATFASYGTIMVAYHIAAGRELRKTLPLRMLLPGVLLCSGVVALSVVLPAGQPLAIAVKVLVAAAAGFVLFRVQCASKG